MLCAPQVISAMDGDEGMEALDGDSWPDFVFLDYTLNVGDSGDEVRCERTSSSDAHDLILPGETDGEGLQETAREIRQRAGPDRHVHSPHGRPQGS